MTTPTPATVAVPVELLTDLIEIVTFHKGSTPAGRAASALIPKPTPRLVAVSYEGLVSSFNMLEGGFTDQLEKYLDRPDLLTLLDEALMAAESDGFVTSSAVVYKRIRAALGVSE